MARYACRLLVVSVMNSHELVFLQYSPPRVRAILKLKSKEFRETAIDCMCFATVMRVSSVTAIRKLQYTFCLTCIRIISTLLFLLLFDPTDAQGGLLFLLRPDQNKSFLPKSRLERFGARAVLASAPQVEYFLSSPPLPWKPRTGPFFAQAGLPDRTGP